MTDLFDPIRLRDVRLDHRIIIPPMAMYRATREGLATDWHLAHYGRLAMGGAAMVMVESTAVSAEGRIGYACLGLWSDDQIAPLRRITDFMRDVGCVPAIQINHTGRKGSWRRPWDGYSSLDDADRALRGEPAWQTRGPSPLAVSPGAPPPVALSRDEIAQIVAEWADAARRADAAGFDVIGIHAAHGYLLNQFLSPVANARSDEYGGSLDNRMRLTLQVAAAVRAAWPDHKPLFLRVSAVDGVEGGWTLDETVTLAAALKTVGVDAIDCSSGGIGGSATVMRVPREAGFQVPFARRVRAETGIPTVAVGLITDPAHAQEVVRTGGGDIIAIGREALVNPNWPSVARTALHPERGHADWNRETGWWLDRRILSVAAPRPAVDA